MKSWHGQAKGHNVLSSNKFKSIHKHLHQAIDYKLKKKASTYYLHGYDSLSKVDLDPLLCENDVKY